MRSDDELLREALSDLHKGDTVERALGRVVRRRGGAYQDYLRIMDSVRELATRDRLTEMEAARKLAHA